ncbi:MAG: DUF1820 family protein [Gammaproteobacteria bacterium]
MDKNIYKVIFVNENKVYEIYAREIYQGELYGFVEVEELIFGEKTSVVVDPAEERLKTEFNGVKRTYIPMHAIIRIDEVEKEGTGKIKAVPGKGDNVSPFPSTIYTPSTDSNK